jgi:hypothetical protein
VVDANAELYLDGIRKNFPSMKDVSVGFCCMKNNIVQEEWGEQGILLDKESVSALAKDILKRLFNVTIVRAKAMFRMKNLVITVVMDNGKEETFELESEKDIDDCVFNYYETYIPADCERMVRNKEAYDIAKKKFEEESKKAKESK